MSTFSLPDAQGGVCATEVISDGAEGIILESVLEGYAEYYSADLSEKVVRVIGPPLEEKYGSRRLLGCIALTALISGLVQFLLFPGSALLGASGIVFMMIVLSSLAGMREGEVPLTLVLVVLLYLGGEVVDAVTARDTVSQLTHIVGGLCGAGLGFAMSRGRRI